MITLPTEVLVLVCVSISFASAAIGASGMLLAWLPRVLAMREPVYAVPPPPPRSVKRTIEPRTDPAPHTLPPRRRLPRLATPPDEPRSMVQPFRAYPGAAPVPDPDLEPTPIGAVSPFRRATEPQDPMRRSTVPIPERARPRREVPGVLSEEGGNPTRFRR